MCRGRPNCREEVPDIFETALSIELAAVRSDSARELKGARLLVQGSLGSSGLLEDYPNLAADVARGESRPAYQRAFVAQLKVFTDRA